MKSVHRIPGLCISLLGLVTNLVCVTAYLRNRDLRNDRSNKHVINVLISNVIITSALNFNNFIFIFNRWDWLVYGMGVSEFGYKVNMGSMLMFSIDRYFCIVHPFRYLQMKIWMRRLLLFLPWLFSLITMAIKVAIYEQDTPHDVQVTIPVTVALVVLINARVFYTVKQQRKAIYRQNSVQNQEQKTSQADKIKDLRLTYACFGAVVTLTTLTAPVIFYHPTPIVKMILMAVASLNSICDPICFMVFNKTLRQQIQNMFKLTSV